MITFLDVYVILSAIVFIIVLGLLMSKPERLGGWLSLIPILIALSWLAIISYDILGSPLP